MHQTGLGISLFAGVIAGGDYGSRGRTKKEKQAKRLGRHLGEDKGIILAFVPLGSFYRPKKRPWGAWSTSKAAFVLL